MSAPKMPSRTLDNIDINTRIVPVQKAFSPFTRRSNHRPIHGFRLRQTSSCADARTANPQEQGRARSVGTPQRPTLALGHLADDLRVLRDSLGVARTAGRPRKEVS